MASEIPCQVRIGQYKRYGCHAVLRITPVPTAPADRDVYLKSSRGELHDTFEALDKCGADKELVALVKQCLNFNVERRLSDAGMVARSV